MKEFNAGDATYWFEVAEDYALEDGMYIASRVIEDDEIARIYNSSNSVFLEHIYLSKEEVIYGMIYKLCRLLKEDKSDFRDLE